MKRFKMVWKRNGGRKVDMNAYRKAFGGDGRDLSAHIPQSKELSSEHIAAAIASVKAKSETIEIKEATPHRNKPTGPVLRTYWQGEFHQGVDTYKRQIISATKYEQLYMYFSGNTFFFIKVLVMSRLIWRSCTYPNRQRADQVLARNDILWIEKTALEPSNDQVLYEVQDS